jgi:thiamine pyrophosphokinase
VSRIIIFANGELADPPAVRALIQPADFIITADGGLRHCRALGLAPRLLIGDLDSTAPADLEWVSATATQISRHPARKDQTDLELALDYAAGLNPDEVLIFGALGGRWDQTLANLLLPAAHSTRIQLIDGPQRITLLRGPGQLTLTGHPGDTVSLIPIAGDAHGLTTAGLEYPLVNGTLPFGATLGVSNVLTAPTATISLQAGSLICVTIANRDAAPLKR